MKPFLLCTDLDRTLIPNGGQPESRAAMAIFRKLASCREVTLAYVTGRHRALIERAIADFDLPQPDYAIADVGATIYRIESSGWRRCDAWDALIAPDWHGCDHEQLQALLSVFLPLHMQEKEKQQRHKLSFYVEQDTDAGRLIEEIEERLEYADVRANLIWSIDEQAGLGLLDVLPVSANKLHAIRFLMQKVNVAREDTIFAGDSGNDHDVLVSDIPAVLVANADEEIKKLVSEANRDTLYLAQGGYLDMNGNYSAGIIEGIAYYRPEVDAWLRTQG